MTNFVKSLFYISACITACVSCQSDTNVSKVSDEKTFGSWVLSEAVKEGKLTKTLEGAKFSIDSLSFNTNLFGEDQVFGYERIGDNIKLSGDRSQLFTVDKSTVDTLILGMKRKRKQYQLLLVKDKVSVED